MSLDHSVRSTGIGASEAAAALGIDPYKTTLELWGEKTGRITPPNLDDNEPVYWGKVIEPLIGQRFAHLTGRHVVHNADQVTARSEAVPFMLATLDFTQHDLDRPGVGALEAKTTSAWQTDKWEEAPPMRVQVQLQHQLAVAGLEWGSIACLVGGQKLFSFDQGRNDRFIDEMVAQEEAFWQLVTSDTPPEVDPDDRRTADALKRLYKKGSKGKTIALPPESAAWVDQRKTLKSQIKALEIEVETIDNKIKAAMGDAERGELPGGGAIKWGTITRNDPPKPARQIVYRDGLRLLKN